jgi:transcriptional regulator with XRE-family HTH domain
MNLNASTKQHTNISPEVSLLREEFQKRNAKNKSYSIRSFSRLLGIDSSTLSQILAGKRRMTTKYKKIFTERLGVSFQTSTIVKNSEFQMLQESQVEVLKNWENYAILELTNTSHFIPEPQWIAKRLGISVPQVHIAIERLLESGLLIETKTGYKKSKNWITNIDPAKTSGARKHLQRELIQKSLQAIDMVPQELKDISAMIFACDIGKLPEARKLIIEFRRKLSKLMSTGNNSEVYQVALQLIPLSEIKEIKKSDIQEKSL